MHARLDVVVFIEPPPADKAPRCYIGESGKPSLGKAIELIQIQPFSVSVEAASVGPGAGDGGPIIADYPHLSAMRIGGVK